MPASATKTAAGDPAKLWVQNPAIDLIVGCGAWSAPLLLISYLASSSHVAAWSIAFYMLALLFNYPHYMATIYRAYHTSEDFQKYRIFTVHITGLVVLTMVLSHFYVRLLPWIFTLYLTWSPWHYSGQNYGLFMMFARRGGATPTKHLRHALYAIFLATYLVLALNLHAGPSGDPMFVSLGLPVLAVRWVTLGLGVACLALAGFGLRALYRQLGMRALIPPAILLSTQFLWFLVPSFLAATGRLNMVQSRYSTGVLAVMHSAQYLWITSYYARREATAKTSRWRALAYFMILVAGGIALFVPGPWLASYVFHFDFTSSFLIFTSLVNLHHFILDGAIWKLRDGRIAGLLLNSPSRLSQAANDMGGSLLRWARWSVSPSAGARTLRIGAACTLLLLAGLDQTRFVLGMSINQPWKLSRAAKLNPFDGTVQLRIARDEANAGHTEEALADFRRAEAARPLDSAVRDQFLQYLISQQRYAEAFELTTVWVKREPKDVDLLVNRGIFANALGKNETARESWEQAIKLDPSQMNAQLYLAELYEKQNQPTLALPRYAAYLDRVAKASANARPSYTVVVAALMRLADCQAATGELNHALHTYDNAAKIANSSGDPRLQSVVATAAAEMQAKRGEFGDAIHLYQQALRVDSTAKLPNLEASDLFHYAELLREHHLDDMAYACLLRAQRILQSNPTAPEFANVQNGVQELEAHSPSGQLRAVRRDPDSALAQALSLPN